MKIFKIFLVSCLVLVFSNNYGQDKNNPWVVNLGVNIVSLQGDNVDADTALGIPSLGISRHIGGGFSLGAQYSINKVKGKSLPQDLSYYSLDGVIKYTIQSKGKTSPYFFAGYGFSAFKDGVDRKGFFPSSDVSETALAGIGLSIDLSDKTAINLSTSYRDADETKAFKHYQHVIGVSIKLGSLDSDGDGISDKNDACPEVPGLEEFSGCPDTDGDGITDNEDQCPDQAGSAEMNGCPDSDGDGIADNVDECPEKAGSADMNGCPDTDGDGVSDKEDACPDEAGENDGCPWPDEDGDGVPDKDDECPKTAGSQENNGCPMIADEVIESLNKEGSMIKFKVSSSVIGKGSGPVLDNIKVLLDKYPKIVIEIQGHASSDGSRAYNQKLSEERAASVKTALTERGSDSNRLSTVGYGEDKPMAKNNTSSGRKANRRVQFSIK